MQIKQYILVIILIFTRSILPMEWQPEDIEKEENKKQQTYSLIEHSVETMIHSDLSLNNQNFSTEPQHIELSTEFQFEQAKSKKRKNNEVDQIDCHLCQKQYHGKNAMKILKRHLKTAHKVDPKTIVNSENINVKEICPVCSQKFSTKYARICLKRHMKKFHPDSFLSNNKNLIDVMQDTSIDDDTQTTLSTLGAFFDSDQPETITTSQLSFPEIATCSVCNKIFTGKSRQSHLSRHFRDFHLKLKHFCRAKTCSKSFNSNNLLLEHIRTDHPELVDQLIKTKKRKLNEINNPNA